MRSAERSLGDQPGTAMLSGHAVDARDLDRLRARQRGQDRGQAPREHRLADAGRPGEQQVVGPRRSDGQRLDDVRVSAHVREIEVALRKREDGLVAIGRGRALAATQDLGHLRQAAGPQHVEPFDQAGLKHPLQRDDEPRQPRSRGALRHRQRAAAGTDLSPEAELAEDGVALERVGRDVTAGGEDRARDGEVEARAGLAQRRRRQVDGQTLEGELEAGVEDRRAHALACLPHRAVAQADDGEGRQSGAHVDLHGDAPRLETIDGEGGDASEHGRHARPRGVTVEPLICTEIA